MSSWLSKSKRAEVVARTNGLCGYCGCEVPSDKETIDHRVPKSKGGGNQVDNLMFCCRTCNTAKGVKTLEEYRLWLKWRDVAKENSFSIYQIKWVVENTDIAERYSHPPVIFYFEEIEELAA